MPQLQSTPPRFHVGDWVSIPYGGGKAMAQIIEDRGPLGVNLQHIYRIQLDSPEGEIDRFELPEETLEIATPEKEDIINYLQQGGLLNILRTNLGGKNPPRVWLTFSSQGKVTHTFQQSRGILGGAEVPFWTLEQDKIFSPKRPQVLEFLQHLGLTGPEAELVVRSVGTAP